MPHDRLTINQRGRPVGARNDRSGHSVLLTIGLDPLTPQASGQAHGDKNPGNRDSQRILSSLEGTNGTKEKNSKDPAAFQFSFSSFDFIFDYSQRRLWIRDKN